MEFSLVQERLVEENRDKMIEVFSGISNCVFASEREGNIDEPTVAFLYSVSPSLSVSTKKILAAVRRVLGGGVYVSDEFAAVIAGKMVGNRGSGQQTQSPVELLSDRELEVFRLLGQGRGTPQIAENLGISLKTVQAYCGRIKEKLALANATELLREAIRFEEKTSAGGKVRP